MEGAIAELMNLYGINDFNIAGDIIYPNFEENSAAKSLFIHKMDLHGPITIPAVIDLHVHLRQDDAMMALAIRAARDGGTQALYVMPNLTPPLTTLAAVETYAARIRTITESLPPSTSGAANTHLDFLFTLYLHPDLTPALLTSAAALRSPTTGHRLIHGVKAYPAGVTTNSSAGVTDFSAFYPLFATMQEHDLILNIHGEVPGLSVLDAEGAFMPTLEAIHAAFPRLRIVLEHVSSQAALTVVERLGENVRCTITAHHLHITSKDWEGVDTPATEAAGEGDERTHKAHNWCKPAAKTEADRIALIRAIVRGGDKVMFGSDSAPHPVGAKNKAEPAAGCFTQGWTASLVLLALDEGVRKGWITKEEVTVDAVSGFLSERGRKWLGHHWKGEEKWIRLTRQGEKTPAVVQSQVEGEAVEVVPFGAGRECWSVDVLDGKPT